mmetsp:Transcript_5246/g.13474  ORF Transcript_5246/g.13474 Transcript_5246/m.13474 type:complete len:95 (-) Transcript_5246:237-521(-)
MGSHQKLSTTLLHQLGGGWTVRCDCGCRPRFTVVAASKTEDQAPPPPPPTIFPMVQTWLVVVVAVVAIWAAYVAGPAKGLARHPRTADVDLKRD